SAGNGAAGTRRHFGINSILSLRGAVHAHRPAGSITHRPWPAAVAACDRWLPAAAWAWQAVRLVRRPAAQRLRDRTARLRPAIGPAAAPASGRRADLAGAADRDGLVHHHRRHRGGRLHGRHRRPQPPARLVLDARRHRVPAAMDHCAGCAGAAGRRGLVDRCAAVRPSRSDAMTSPIHDASRRRFVGALAAGSTVAALPGHGLTTLQESSMADLIVHNARITTLDPKQPLATAIAVANGVVVAVGDEATVMEKAGSNTRIVDAAGRRLIPGLNDSHTHLIRGGLNYNLELRWDGVRSLADAMAMLKAQVARTPAPQWVRVIGGFTEHQFIEKRMPTLDEINAIAPDT